MFKTKYGQYNEYVENIHKYSTYSANFSKTRCLATTHILRSNTNIMAKLCLHIKLQLSCFSIRCITTTWLNKCKRY